MRHLLHISEVIALLEEGKRLIVAGDEEVLKKIPAGNWIGGTIPYFMSDQGGVVSRETLYVTELPSFVSKIKLKTYSEGTIDQVYKDGFAQGFSIILIPASSPVHMTFALKAPEFEDFLKVPLIGWITGVHLDDLGTIAPRTFYGPSRKSYSDKAVVVHCSLPEGRIADMDIINGFEPDTDSPAIQFPENGFSATSCTIDGEEKNLAEYIQDKGINTQLPLVADYNGVMINISFQTVDTDAGRVDFYAPIFQGVTYHLAKPVEDYISDFHERLEGIEDPDNIFFSCNCILNFLYGELEGKQTGPITGPITFGEVAYQLLNQTLVYLRIL